jgi:hypothetical protein
MSKTTEVKRMYSFTDDPSPWVDQDGDRWTTEKKNAYIAPGSTYVFEYLPRPEYVRHGMMPGGHEHGGAECRCGASWDQWADKCTAPWHEMRASYAGFNCICDEWKIGSWNDAHQTFARHLAAVGR